MMQVNIKICNVEKATTAFFSAVPIMSYIFFGRRAARCLQCFMSCLDIGLSALPSVFYIFFRPRTQQRCVFYVLLYLWA
jgi:hypothetical protein